MRHRELTEEQITEEFERNEGLAVSVALRFAGQMPEEDLKQHARLGLLQAILYFNPAAGFAFSTYAFKVIERTLIRAVQIEGKQTRGALSLDVMLAPDDADASFGEMIEDPHPTPEQIAMSVADAALIWRYVPRLTPHQQRIIQMRYKGPGLTQREVARQLGVRNATVHILEKRALQRLRILCGTGDRA